MRNFFLVLAVTTLAAAPVPRTGAPLPLSTPEREGFSSARLERMHEALATLARDGKRSGVSVLVARNGRLVDWHAWGLRDIEAKLPMEKDTICRIYSMTKVVTAVAAMALYEEGRFELNAPVEKYVPELKDMRVFEGGTADDPYLVPARSPMTIKHLLTHTSGLIYGGTQTPVQQIWTRAKIFDDPPPASLREWIPRIGKLPLAAHPGETWIYGVSSDVLGYVVEAISGMPFDQFVQKRILDPLVMRDTHFFLPPDKKSRAAKLYQFKDDKLAVTPDPDYKFAAGGMALWSTIGDYARFAQMLLNGGQLDGAPVLGRKTVELMEANHLSHLKRTTIGGNESEGFGLGGAVRIDLARGDSLGSVGQFGWSGAASTWFRIDPKEKVLLLLFQQRFPNDNDTARRFSNLVYQALVD